jgi:DNA-binding NarL/FixJ family response regulator
VESYDEFSDVLCDGAHGTFDLVIITNSSVPPSRIQTLVADIKARLPDAPLIVLSGYCPEDFVANLMLKGIDGFLPLPFVQDTLLKQVDGLLSTPTP